MLVKYSLLRDGRYRIISRQHRNEYLECWYHQYQYLNHILPPPHANKAPIAKTWWNENTASASHDSKEYKTEVQWDLHNANNAISIIYHLYVCVYMLHTLFALCAEWGQMGLATLCGTFPREQWNTKLNGPGMGMLGEARWVRRLSVALVPVNIHSVGLIWASVHYIHAHDPCFSKLQNMYKLTAFCLPNYQLSKTQRIKTIGSKL